MLIKAFTATTNKYQMIKIDDLIVHLTILLTYDQSLLLTQITSFAFMLVSLLRVVRTKEGRDHRRVLPGSKRSASSSVFEWVMGWTPRGKPCSS